MGQLQVCPQAQSRARVGVKNSQSGVGQRDCQSHKVSREMGLADSPGMAFCLGFAESRSLNNNPRTLMLQLSLTWLTNADYGSQNPNPHCLEGKRLSLEIPKTPAHPRAKQRLGVHPQQHQPSLQPGHVYHPSPESCPVTSRPNPKPTGLLPQLSQ